MTDLESYFKQKCVQPFLGYTQNMIVLTDTQGGLLEWNPAFDRLKAVFPSVSSLQDILSDSSRSLFSMVLETQEPRHLHLQLLSAAGGGNLNCLLTPIPGGKILLCAEPALTNKEEELAHLADELVKTRRSLKIKEIELEAVLVQADEVSHTDSLTFLTNRKGITADLQREIARSDRYHKPLTIFMADIDHFKPINDSFGHFAGDQVLRNVASEMFASIRQIDKVGRYGGDEFLFILPTTGKKSSIQIADRLLEIVRAQVVKIEGDQTQRVTISIGIAQYRIGKENWEDLLNRADKALYAAKVAGRDRWTIANIK